MIRSELVARIAEQNPHLYAREVEGVVDTILERIDTALSDGGRVELRDFGTFSIRRHESRTVDRRRSVTPFVSRLKSLRWRLNWMTRWGQDRRRS